MIWENVDFRVTTVVYHVKLDGTATDAARNVSVTVGRVTLLLANV